MYRATTLLFATLILSVGCGNADVTETTKSDGETAKIASTTPEVTFKPGATGATTVKPSGPVTIAYRLIGNPIVGQPLTVELQFETAIGPQQMTVSYRVNDATALQFPESQPTTMAVAPAISGERISQQVTVIPLREGRLYLNVAANIETENGSVSSVTAIPIQVGGSIAREVESNGVRRIDENGETVISLPGKED